MCTLCFRFLSHTQLNLLKLSLSLRTESPRIEMFQQIAIDRGVRDRPCPRGIVMEAAGKLVCEVDKLNLDPKAEAPKLFQVDHHYPRSEEEGLPTVVLYARPGEEGFAAVHAKLKDKAERGEIDYVLRPFLKVRPEQKTRLSGEMVFHILFRNEF